MLSLSDLQGAFRAAILAEDPAVLAPEIVADEIAPERRIAIYRNNTFASLTEALKATFPVVCRLVDERFFAYAAHEFIAAHPPRHGRLHAYGAAFPRFLDGFAAARSLPYLADVARFEWAMAEAFHEADALPLDPSALATIDLGTVERLRFVPHPTVRLLASPWPIDRIWEANQPDAADTTIALDAGGASLVVQRPRLEVVYRSPAKGSFALLRWLAAGRSLGDAAERALAEDPSLDLRTALLDHLVAGTFSGFATT
ncbi:MAG: DNA-binding domain-containing protein [Alphaproteobacteria bacterium]